MVPDFWRQEFFETIKSDPSETTSGGVTTHALPEFLEFKMNRLKGGH